MTETPTESLAAIEALLHERRTFPPVRRFQDERGRPDDIGLPRAAEDPGRLLARARTGVPDLGARADARASSGIRRTAPGSRTGELNVSANCLDRHVRGGRGDRVAYHWVGEPEGETRDVTYAELYSEVCRLANGPQGARRREGRPGRDLHGDGAGAPGRDARLRADRRSPRRRLRRLLGRLARRAAPLDRGEGARSRRTRAGGRAARCRSRRTRTTAVDETPSIETRRRSSPDRRRGRWNDERDVWWHELVERRGRTPRRLSPWTQRTRSSCSTRPARRRSRRASCTRAAATSRRSRSRTSGSSTSTTTRSGGARPTSAGSPATATSSTGRSRTASRACSTRATRRIRTGTATGRSSSATGSTRTTRRRRSSARS